MPLINLEEFRIFHQLQNEKFISNMTMPTKGRRVLPALANELMDRNARHLHAVNCRARIAVGTSMRDEMSRFCRLNKEDMYFFVTVTPAHFAQTLREAQKFNVREILRWVQEQLGRLSHVSCVEAAMYTNLGMAAALVRETTISWHTHSVVWGCDRSTIETKIQDLNRRLAPHVQGLAAAHFRILSAGQVPGRALYMLKGPWLYYRVKMSFKRIHDRRTGKYVLQPSGRLDQRSEAVKNRFKHALEVAGVMVGRRIPDFMFAAGEGVVPHRQAIDKALQRIAEQDEKEEARIWQVLYGGRSIVTHGSAPLPTPLSST